MTTFLNETFTDTNSTTIASHTGELGATWTEHTSYTAGESRIDTNRCRCQTGPSAYYASGTASDPDYYVEAVCVVVSTAATYAGGAIRMSTSADTMYYWYYDGGAWQVLKRVAGASGVLGTGWSETLNASDSRTVKLHVTGSGATVTLRLYVDGVLRVDTTDTAGDRIVATGKVGFRIPIAGAAGTGMQIASITAVDPSVAASYIPLDMAHTALHQNLMAS